MRVIIPIAGNGQRFRDAGYTAPKPLIRLRDGEATMFEWAVSCLPREGTEVITVQRSDADHGIVPHADCRRCAGVRIAGTVIPGPTQGAACTVLAAAVGIPWDEPVAVMNADQVFRADLARIEAECLERGDDGFILTFKATDKKWSFVDATMDGRVELVAEKDPISNDATVGFYWFRRAGDLVWAIATAIHMESRVRGEFYLAPVYNHLILRLGKRIRAVPVEWFHGLGTPEDVEAFNALDEVPL